MSLWTVQQHEWLQALGHPVLLLAGDPSLAAVPSRSTEAAASAASPAASAPESREDATPVRVETPTLPARPGDVDKRASARSTPPANPVGSPDPHAGDTGAAAPRTDAAGKKAALEAARGARRAARPAPVLPTDDPLVQAITRASGLDAEAFVVAARTWQVDLAGLRAQPSLKRALWKQMRDMRRNRTR